MKIKLKQQIKKISLSPRMGNIAMNTFRLLKLILCLTQHINILKQWRRMRQYCCHRSSYNCCNCRGGGCSRGAFLCWRWGCHFKAWFFLTSSFLDYPLLPLACWCIPPNRLHHVWSLPLVSLLRIAPLV